MEDDYTVGLRYFIDFIVNEVDFPDPTSNYFDCAGDLCYFNNRTYALLQVTSEFLSFVWGREKLLNSFGIKLIGIDGNDLVWNIVKLSNGVRTLELHT